MAQLRQQSRWHMRPADRIRGVRAAGLERTSGRTPIRHARCVIIHHPCLQPDGQRPRQKPLQRSCALPASCQPLNVRAQAIGDLNTLPLELQGLTTTVTTPVIYALGTLTTAISFVVVGITIALMSLGRRRARGKP